MSYPSYNNTLPSISTGLIQNINQLAKTIEDDQSEVDNTINSINTSSTISIERHWYGTVDRQSIEDGFNTVYRDFSQIFKGYGNAIKKANSNSAKILDLLKCQALIDKDIYDKLDDFSISNNEFKSVLEQWLKQQGVNDDDIRQLLETSFKRAYTLRNRLNQLRTELSHDIERCSGRINILENKYSQLESQISRTITEETAKIRNYVSEAKSFRDKCSEFLNDIQNIQKQLQKDIQESRNTINSETQKSLDKISEKSRTIVSDFEKKKTEFQNKINTAQNQYLQFTENKKKEIDVTANKIKDDYSKKSAELNSTYGKIVSNIDSISGKSINKINEETEISLKSIQESWTAIQGNINTSLEDINRNADTRKQEIDNIATETKLQLQKQIEQQAIEFGKELAEIKKQHNRRLIASIVSSCFISSILAILISYFI